MTKKFDHEYSLLEVVMFVLSGKSGAIARMKRREKGFFKGAILKETKDSVWIKPFNKDLCNRLATSKATIFHKAAVIEGRRVIILNDCYMKHHKNILMSLYAKYKTRDVYLVDCIILPKKQVTYFYGSQYRILPALDSLVKSDSVQIRNPNNKAQKIYKNNRWVYVV